MVGICPVNVSCCTKRREKLAWCLYFERLVKSKYQRRRLPPQKGHVKIVTRECGPWENQHRHAITSLQGNTPWMDILRGRRLKTEKYYYSMVAGRHYDDLSRALCARHMEICIAGGMEVHSIQVVVSAGRMHAIRRPTANRRAYAWYVRARGRRVRESGRGYTRGAEWERGERSKGRLVR